MSHLSLGLPTGLDEHGSHSVSFLTGLIVSILIRCAAQRNLCDFINLTIVSFLTRISNSSFVFILHVPSLSCVGTYIFLSTLLSNISRRFCSVTVIAHVTIGRMIDLYICSLMAALRSCLSYVCVYNMQGVYDSVRLRLEVSLMYVHNRECIRNTARISSQFSVIRAHNWGYVCNRVNVLQEMQCTKHRQIRCLMTRTKMFLKTSV